MNDSRDEKVKWEKKELTKNRQKKWKMINETIARVLLQGQELKHCRPSEADDNPAYKPPSS